VSPPRGACQEDPPPAAPDARQALPPSSAALCRVFDERFRCRAALVLPVARAAWMQRSKCGSRRLTANVCRHQRDDLPPPMQLE